VPGQRVNRRLAALAAILVGAFVARFLLGLNQQLDGDEATLGLAANGILHGHLIVSETNLHYLGAFEAYVAAPFVAVFGTTVTALRVAMAVVGTAYVASMFWLGRALFQSWRGALLLAAVAAVFPLFALTWPDKARWGYSEQLLFAGLLLAIGVQILWRGWSRHPGAWLLFGLVLGVALWNSSSALLPFGVLVVALLMRMPALGWRIAIGGAAVAVAGALITVSPWLIYNVHNGFPALNHLPTYSTGKLTAVKGVLQNELPILAGTEASCSAPTVPAAVGDAAVALLALGIIVVRRRELLNLVRGRLGTLQPVETVLVLFPLGLVPLVIGRFNGLPCEPRYGLGVVLPLAVGLSVVLLARAPLRWIALAGVAGWLTLSGVAASTQNFTDSRDYTTTGKLVPLDLSPSIQALRTDVGRGDVIVADYWLARPVEYLSGDSLPVYSTSFDHVPGAPNGWLFVSGDPSASTLASTLQQIGKQFERLPAGDLVLYRLITS
jgi:hypothetical protein